MQQAIPDEDTIKLNSIQVPKQTPLPEDSEQNDMPEHEGNSDALGVSINWREALRQIAPIYVVTHIAFLALTYLATLFSLGNFSDNALHLRILLDSWYRWDSGQYTHIAQYGYDAAWRTAFFPLFPILEHILTTIVRDPFVAGLIISNIATLCWKSFLPS